MSTSVSIYATKNTLSAFTDDNSYELPLSFGSLSFPLNGLTGDVQAPFAVWVKNTGTTKLTNIVLSAIDGEVDIKGGVASQTDDAYVEFALDDSSNLPNAQTVPPSIFVGVASSTESPLIPINNVSSASHVKKLLTTLDADDDARSMLENEYCIVWLRCVISAAKAPGGVLPTLSGIKNIKLLVTAKGV